MAKALLEWETIDLEQINDIMDGRDPRAPKDPPPASPKSDDDGGDAAVGPTPSPNAA